MRGLDDPRALLSQMGLAAKAWRRAQEDWMLDERRLFIFQAPIIVFRLWTL